MTERLECKPDGIEPIRFARHVRMLKACGAAELGGDPFARFGIHVYDHHP